jgi:hypothetical protein
MQQLADEDMLDDLLAVPGLQIVAVPRRVLHG